MKGSIVLVFMFLFSLVANMLHFSHLEHVRINPNGEGYLFYCYGKLVFNM